MDKILHDLKDPKLWELWYIPYMGNAGFCPSAVLLIFVEGGILDVTGRNPHVSRPGRWHKLEYASIAGL